ncbi:alpha/beta-hydrolase [Tilletiaria anomala UBC 951]|uniref:Carboxypeptidase n=1 Tax=Tilletiaria anomala (strain ATCC 24038 / CBS 436.72 / UBC 951) TaxID=1037660 RepID=A0A066W1E4_TILAU|nr:alpha/beta-hydrolase [Tilletiaria anomala UBC 951]KDN47566.1 alpha/beta-hydrolase [Tilletiaria anomala UBC 951]
MARLPVSSLVSLALSVAALGIANTGASPSSPHHQLSFQPDASSGVFTHAQHADDLLKQAASAVGQAGSASSSTVQDDPFRQMMGSFAPSSSLRIELPYESVEASSMAGAAARSVEQMIIEHSNKTGGMHAILTHREFPEVSVRIKHISSGTKAKAATGQVHYSAAEQDRSDPDAFCDPGVSSWSGYIDTIDGKSLFFYFFESRSNPDKDPVLFWTNGGPGCSSSLGLFQELGPCRVELGSSKHATGPPINGTEVNPYAWNTRANTIFIDQPVGVGYSYTRYGVHVGDTESASHDVYKFLRIFFSAFDRFHDNGLILSGESYGGRYLPIFASEVVDRNQAYELQAQKHGKTKPSKEQIVPLKSVLIGNGLTDISRQVPQYYDFTCTKKGGFKPYLSIEQCTRMKVYRDKCAKELAVHCRESYNADKCADLNMVCQSELFGVYAQTGRNPYDITDDCKAGLTPNLCYPVSADIRNYLDRDDVRSLIGAAPKSQIGKFRSCNFEVGASFEWHYDSLLDNSRNIAGLLERDIDVLIYVGEKDVICNWLGNKAWVMDLEWSGKDAFHANKLRRWRVDGDDAGETQHGGGLTWATIKGAGHMAPYDKPAASLAMLHRFLDGETL